MGIAIEMCIKFAQNIQVPNHAEGVIILTNTQGTPWDKR
jgi:hypothetical protein